MGQILPQKWRSLSMVCIRLNKPVEKEGLSLTEKKHKREQREPRAGWFHILH